MYAVDPAGRWSGAGAARTFAWKVGDRGAHVPGPPGPRDLAVGRRELRAWGRALTHPFRVPAPGLRTLGLWR